MTPAVTKTLDKVKALCQEASWTDFLIEVDKAWYAIMYVAPTADGGATFELWSSDEDGTYGKKLQYVKVSPDGTTDAPSWFNNALK